MFNTYVHETTVTEGPRYPQTIHEHRAPTDAAIKLYGELEEKAIRNVIKSYTIQDNIVNGSVVICKKPMTMGYVIHFSFLLNGRRFTVTEECEGPNMSIESKGDAVKALIRKSVSEITAVLLMANRETFDNV